MILKQHTHIKVVSDIYVLSRLYEVPGKEMQHRKKFDISHFLSEIFCCFLI